MQPKSPSRQPALSQPTPYRFGLFSTKGQVNRSVRKSHIVKRNGKTYERYLHATKGWRERRLIGV